MPPPSLEPQQERSRKTLEKLLEGAIKVLERDGLDGATLPAIVAEAGVSVGAVYQRFADKDGLLRAVFLALLEQSAESNRRNLRPEVFAGVSFDGVIRSLVRAMIHQFRTRPGLLRALEDFIENQQDEAFTKRAVELIAGNYERITDILLLHRGQISHPDPRKAALFAVVSAVTVIQARILAKDPVAKRVAPLDDEVLEVEVSRLMRAYLSAGNAK